MHFSDILHYLKNWEFKSVISESYLKACVIQMDDKTNLYTNRRSSFVEVIYTILDTIGHKNSLPMAVFLFDKLTEHHCKHTRDNRVKEKELYIHVITAILTSGKFC